MSFSNPKTHQLTNKEEKEEQARLVQKHEELRVKIATAEQEKKHLSDLSDDIKKHEALVSKLKTDVLDLNTRLSDKQKEHDKVASEHTKLVGAVENLKAIHAQKTNEIIEKTALLNQVTKKTAEIDARQTALTTEVAQMIKNISELNDLKAEFNSDIQRLTAKKEEIGQFIARNLLESERLFSENVKLQQDHEAKKLELDHAALSIVAKQKEHESVTEMIKQDQLKAEEKIKDMFVEAEKEIQAKILLLEQREGEVSLLKAKQDKQKEKLMKWHKEMEEYHGKPLPMNFE